MCGLTSTKLMNIFFIFEYIDGTSQYEFVQSLSAHRFHTFKKYLVQTELISEIILIKL